MRGGAGIGIHLVPVEAEVGGGIELYGVLAEEMELMSCTEGLDARVNRVEVDCVGRLFENAHLDGTISAVTDAGERKGAVEIDGNGGTELAACGELADKGECGAHGTHGVRARRP